MLAWKVAPALACGNTVVLKPAETTPLTALLFTDVCRQAELPPGVVNILTGDGSTGAHLVQHEGIDKVAFTGSTEVGKAIQRELAGRGVALTLELGGKAANIVFDDAALDQAVEGIVNGIYFNQGHVCCAGSRLLVQESIYEPLIAKLKRRLGTLRVGDPLDKNTDVGAINSKAQLDKITELVEAGKDEGAEIYQPPCRLPEKGYWFAPTVFTNVAQSYRIAQEEIFGPGAVGADLPHARGGGREGEQHGVRALGGRVDGEGLADPLDGRAAARRRRVGEHVQPLRPGLAVRRLQGVRLRPRGRPSRARGLPEVRRMSRLPVRKTYKLFVGGAFPRSESGRTYEAEGQNVARASRKDVRDAVRAARGAAAKWAGATAYNRGQVLYRLAEMMEARADELARVAPAGRRWRPRSTASSGTRAGRTSFLRCSAAPTRWRARTSTSPCRSRPASSRSWRRTSRPRTGSSRGSRPRSSAATRSSRSRPRRTRWLRSSWPRRWRPRTFPGGVVNVLTGFRDELAPVLASHMDVNAIDVTGADGAVAELERLAAENVKRVVRSTPDAQSPWEIERFLELKTVWHPVGQ